MDRRQFLTRTAALTAAAPLLSAAFPSSADAASRDAGAPDVGSPDGVRAAGQLPSRSKIVAVLRRVADQWIAAHPDPGPNTWDRATFFSGLMALHLLTGDQGYLSYVRAWAEQHQYGLNGGTTTRNADNQCAGQTYLDLHDLDGDPQQIAAIEECLHSMVYVDQPEKDDDWWWDDALHMGMSPFARIGGLRNDTAYYDKLYGLYGHTKHTEGGPGLYDPATGLWYRDKRFLPGGIVSPTGKPVVWSRGNGWVAGGHTKTLKALPAGEPHVAEYRQTLVQLLAAVRQVQRPDGFWNVNLADPAHLPGPETSGTAFFTYGTAYAIRAGLLPAAAYLPVAGRAWNGMVATAVHPDGVLGYVQGTGDRPESSQPVTYDSTADFGVGAFLLAGTELARLQL
jgi:unsaturated rhamnogalacturonyl hydrolase